jgi:biotin carboxyl carrier protein
MNKNNLKRLGRKELLEMLLEISKENERLRKQNSQLEKQLQDRALAIEESGSIAEAALRLNEVFEAAQEACDQYLYNALQRCRKMEEETKEQCKQMLGEKKQQAELQHYQYLQQRSVDALKQEKKTEQEKLNGYILTAPEDGKVFDFANIQAGDPVTAGQTLMTFVQTDVVQLQVRNSAGELRYNMPVKVTVGRRNARTVLTGRIVAADGAIPQKERTGFAYISVETDKEMIDPKITAETVRLDNVLVVARNAVVMENGKYYVTKLADGMLQKRCIGFGMNSTSDAWIIHGVVSGDTLIAD